VRKLLIGLVVACRGQPTLPPPPYAPITMPSTYQLPLKPFVAAWELTCRGDEVDRHNTSHYEFEKHAIEPVRRGPLIADRSHAGPARTSLQLEEAFDREQAAIVSCWKWAAARGGTPVNVEVGFTVDPFGKTSALSVTAAKHGNAELVGCLQDNLRGLELHDPSPRTTRMSATIAFTLADQAPWTTLPTRPTRAARSQKPQRVCTPVVVDGPIDQVTAPIPFAVSDADSSRGSQVISVRNGCGNVYPPYLNKWDIRAAINANLGAFQRCYADALERDPELTGTLTVHAVFGPGPFATNVTAGGAGDTSFGSCMATAAREIWLATPSTSRNIEIVYPFELTPASPAPKDKSPDALLASDDADAAIDVWAAQLEKPRDAIAACHARIGILRAFAAKAPWPDDARIDVALRELGAFAATMRAGEAYACLEPVSDYIRDLALPRNSRQRNLRWSLLPRVEAALPIARVIDGVLAHRPPLTDGSHRWLPALRLYHADLLMVGARYRDGLAELKEIAAAKPADDDDDVPRIATREVENLKETHPLSGYGCP